MSKIFELTDQTFEKKVLQSKNFILVDFWAEWCNPCKLLAPILEEISIEYFPKITIGKINVENNPKISSIYSIRSIPTLLLFSNGEVLATKVGSVSKLQLIEFLNQNIN